jgi:hypothetical protein
MVFGKQFSNSHANSGSLITFFMRVMVASTAGLVKLRLSAGMRTTGKSALLANDHWGTAIPATANAPALMKSRLKNMRWVIMGA